MARKTVVTELQSIHNEYTVEFSYDTKVLDSLHAMLDECNEIKLNDDKTKAIRLIEAYRTVQLSGKRPSPKRILKGKEEHRSDIMVEQALLAEEFIFNKDTVKESVLKDCYSVLTANSWKSRKETVSYRDEMVYVDSYDRVVHVPASPEEVEELMNSLIFYTTGDDILDAILYHFYIGYIHPFADGNGRFARLMCNYFIGIKGFPLSATILNDTGLYYNSFLASELQPGKLDITPFVEVMFHTIAHAGTNYKLYGLELVDSELNVMREIEIFNLNRMTVEKAAAVIGTSFTKAATTLSSVASKGHLLYEGNGVYSVLKGKDVWNKSLASAIDQLNLKML